MKGVINTMHAIPKSITAKADCRNAAFQHSLKVRCIMDSKRMPDTRTMAEMLEAQRKAKPESKEYEPTYAPIPDAPCVMVAETKAGTVLARMERKIEDDKPYVIISTFKGGARVPRRFGVYAAIPWEQFTDFVAALSVCEDSSAAFLKTLRK
jgi:hypothetical protein